MAKKKSTKSAARKKASSKSSRKKTAAPSDVSHRSSEDKTIKKKTSRSTKKRSTATAKKASQQTKASADPAPQPAASAPPEPVPDNGAARRVHAAQRVVRPAPPLDQDEQSHEHLSENKLKRCKSGLRKKDLEEFRRLLMEKRAEIIGDVMSMEQDTRNNGGGGNLSHMPVHMADVGSDYYEQEFNLSLMESERKLLREIDQALERMDKGYFGVCLESGQPIERARLEIKPWAKYCIAVMRERERLGLM